MRQLNQNQRGQGNMIAAVKGLAVLIVVVAIFAFAYSEIRGATVEQRLGTTYTDATLNSDFADNTGGKPDYWDNYVENNAVNARNAGGYITTTVTDNLNKYENGVWKQALAVADIRDEVTSATLSFKWRLIDNDNLSAIRIRAYLDDGTDNTLIFSENSVENTSSWNSQENDVTSIVSAVGTYTIWLRAEITPKDTVLKSNIVVGFDDASLTVDSYEKGLGEDIGDQTGGSSVTVFKLLLLVIVVVAIAFVLRSIGVL